ncbi:MAG: hypothetical protein Q7T56_17910 [Nocardioidaceae bacterium]|nr:hypothetical protein [Nocardioidaceae bacterium]
MEDAPADEPIAVKIMNEYSVDMPLWYVDAQDDGDDLPISDGLRRDLRAFARRWDDTVDDDVFDDRFDRMPPVRFVVDSWRSLTWRLSPGKQQHAASEDAALRQTGERLRVRLQDELGDGYRVTYHH